jgi:hypothetical protein
MAGGASPYPICGTCNVVPWMPRSRALLPGHRDGRHAVAASFDGDISAVIAHVAHDRAKAALIDVVDRDLGRSRGRGGR